MFRTKVAFFNIICRKSFDFFSVHYLVLGYFCCIASVAKLFVSELKSSSLPLLVACVYKVQLRPCVKCGTNYTKEGKQRFLLSNEEHEEVLMNEIIFHLFRSCFFVSL